MQTDSQQHEISATIGTQDILVVDDEAKLVRVVQAYLERDGYRVRTAADGAAALNLVRLQRPDLIILDLMLPKVSGWDVCRALRRDPTAAVPIIMLTARDAVSDRIVGLELGADDYLVKPFDPHELVARVHAVLRRTTSQPVAGLPSETRRLLEHGDLCIDLDRHEVRRAGMVIPLTPGEFDLLATLAARPGYVFSRLQLLDAVKGEAFEGYDRSIDTHIKNLRRKLEPDPRHPRYVQTVFGVGYRFETHDPVLPT
jgi:DNA-binding response OmpR family regulator